MEKVNIYKIKSQTDDIITLCDININNKYVSKNDNTIRKKKVYTFKNLKMIKTDNICVVKNIYKSHDIINNNIFIEKYIEETQEEYTFPILNEYYNEITELSYNIYDKINNIDMEIVKEVNTSSEIIYIRLSENDYELCKDKIIQYVN